LEQADRADEGGGRIVGEAGDKRIGGGVVGNPRMPARKTTDLPAADNLVEPEGRRSGYAFSPAEGQFVDEVAVQVIGHVEIRVTAAFARPVHAADIAIAHAPGLE